MNGGIIVPETDNFGPLRIWHAPQAGKEYVIGCDIAEGKATDPQAAHGDFSAAFVIEAATMNHVATWHGLMDPWPFSDELAALGYYYNTALLAPEKNNHGGTVVKRLLNEIKYPNLYRQRASDPTRPIGRQQIKDEYGFTTTGSKGGGGTKALVVDMLRNVTRRIIPIHDIRFHTEALTWILDDSGKPVTNEGANDDLLMAMAIAYYVANEAYGSVAWLQQPVAVLAADKDAYRRKSLWEKLTSRTAEVQKGKDPMEGVPAEVRTFYD